MAWRRRGVRFRRYQPPPVRPIAPIDSVVSDGVAILNASVRLAVKNSLIIAALRDNAEFDPDTYAAVAIDQLNRLAIESEATAERLEVQAAGQDEDLGGADIALYLNRREELARGPAVYQMLSTALKVEAADPVQVGALVARAREDASDEIRHETTSRLLRTSFEPDVDYATERSARMKALKEVDIAALFGKDDGA